MRHRDDCGCDVCSKDPFERERMLRQSALEFAERCRKIEKVHAVFDFLEIPYHDSLIMGQDHMSVLALYDILMDEEKLRVLVSKLRNKAFW